MKGLALVGALILCGCTDTQLALQYAVNKPQRFETSIPGLDISTLQVFRSERRPGKLWVAPNGGKLVASAWDNRQTQFTAMLDKTIEPAYREAAISALKESPGGSCGIDSFVPWPDQFAIEYTYTCK